MKERSSNKRPSHDRHEESPSVRTAEHPVQQSPTMLNQHDEIRGRFGNAAQLAGIDVEPNKTGLPDNLKAGIENLSGIAMDNVRVHFNSAEPAKLDAAAYAQGSSIHLAPGQEQHLPHEAWHVVQQAQGRVTPTRQHRGVVVNDQDSLETEATVMGKKALQAAPRAAGFAADSEHADSTTTRQLAISPEGTMQLQLNYSGTRAICENESLTDKKHFRSLTGGMNKEVYVVKDKDGTDTGWVLLLKKPAKAEGHDIGAESPKSFLESELGMLNTYRAANVPVPATADKSGEGVVFMTKDNRPAFLQEFVPGFEPPRGQYSYHADSMDEFIKRLESSWRSENTWTDANRKVTRAKDCLERIQAYLIRGEEMPDLQFRYNEESGDILVLDPGRSTASGSVKGHQEWVRKLLKFTNNFDEGAWKRAGKAGEK